MVFEKMLNKRLFVSLAIMLCILLSVLWILQSLRFINVIVNENVSFFNYFKLIILLIPDIITLVLPFCILIAGVWVYVKMINNNELIVLFSLGASKFQVSKPLMKIGIIGFLTSFIISIWILPWSLRVFKDQRFLVNHHVLSLLMQEETFYSFKDITFFFEKKLKNEPGFENIFIESNKKSIMAEKAVIVSSKNSKVYLNLFNGSIIDRSKNDSFNQITFKSLVYEIEPFASTRVKVIAEEDTFDLFFPKNKPSKEIAVKMKIEGHKRIILPVLVFINALLTCVFILQKISFRKFPKTHVAKIIFSCFFIDFLFYEILHLAKYNYNLVYVVYLSAFLIIISCISSLVYEDIIQFLKTRKKSI